MRSLARSLTLGATLVLLVLPAWAQDDEPTAPANNEPSPAAESAKAGARGATTGPSRRALLRAWHAKRQAALALKEQQAALRESAELQAAAAPPAPAPSPEPAHAETKLDSSALDSHPLDTLPGAGPAEAVKPEEHPAVPTEPAVPAHGETAHGEGEHGAGHGGEHSEHAGFSVKTFILQLINFGVLLFLLIYFGGRAMNKALRARHEQLRTEIGEASRLRDEAKRNFAAQEQRMAELEKEIAALRETMRKEAEREQARLLESARERGKKMQEEMRAQIDEQVKVAEAALRAEVASAAIALAEELTRKAVGFEDERRLAREFVASFDASAAPDGEVR